MNTHHENPTSNINNLKNIFKKIVENYNKNQPSNDVEQFEYEFHLRMQDPANHILKFDNVTRDQLNNGVLYDLGRYYDAKGMHIFATKIDEIIISNVCLSKHAKDNHMGVIVEEPGGISFVAELIAKNPSVAKINLSNTRLGENEGLMLLEALDRNTKLIEFNLDCNNINPETLRKIQEKVQENIKQIPHTLKCNPRCHGFFGRSIKHLENFLEQQIGKIKNIL